MPTSPDEQPPTATPSEPCGGGHALERPPRRPWWLHPLTLLWIGCWAGLFVLTHVPVPEGVPMATGMDKVIHLVAYFALATLGGRAAVSRGVHVTRRWIVTWTVIYAAYAVVDEVLQGLALVNRTASLMDWLADLAGLLLAAALLWMYPNPTLGNATEVQEDDELFRL